MLETGTWYRLKLICLQLYRYTAIKNYLYLCARCFREVHHHKYFSPWAENLRCLSNYIFSNNLTWLVATFDWFAVLFLAWFLSIQVMMTLTMLAELVILALIILFILNICHGRNSFGALMSIGVAAIVCGKNSTLMKD